MVPGMMLVLYLVSPGSLASVSFYRLSLSLSIHRNSVGTVFLIVSFPNDNTETFGTISTTNVLILCFFDSIPTIFLSTFLAVLVSLLLKSHHPHINGSSYVVLCFQALEMIPIRRLLNLALPPWGREDHFFPSSYYTSVGYLLIVALYCCTANAQTRWWWWWLSYGRDIGKGAQVLSMLAWRTACLLCRRLLIVVLNLRCEREWGEG